MLRRGGWVECRQCCRVEQQERSFRGRTHQTRSRLFGIGNRCGHTTTAYLLHINVPSKQKISGPLCPDNTAPVQPAHDVILCGSALQSCGTSSRLPLSLSLSSNCFSSSSHESKRPMQSFDLRAPAALALPGADEDINVAAGYLTRALLFSVSKFEVVWFVRERQVRS